MEQAAFTFSLALCAGLNMADGIITVSVIHIPELREANPMTRFALKSPPLYMAFKGLSSVIIYEGLHTLFKNHKTLSWISVVVLDFAFSYAIVHNLHLIWRFR